MDFYTTTAPKSNVHKQNMPIFAITSLDPTNESSAKSFIDYQKNNDVKSGMTILKTVVQDTTFDGLKFYSLTIIEADNKTKATKTNLYGFLFTDSKAVIFLGSDMGKHEYLNALRKTFYAMRLK